MMGAPRPVVSPLAPTAPAPPTAAVDEDGADGRRPSAAPIPFPGAAPPPPLAPAPKPTPVSSAPLQAQPYTPPYTPPAKGSFGPFSRALAFMGQIFSLAGTHKALLKPLHLDVTITTVVMAGFTVLEFFVRSRGASYAVMGVEAFLLYFIDYACNSITASLMYDYAPPAKRACRRPSRG